MPDPVIDPPRTNVQHESIECEFCDCRLSRKGQVLSRSKKAREMIDLNDENGRLQKRIDALTVDLTAAREEISTLKTAHPPAQRNDDDWDDD